MVSAMISITYTLEAFMRPKIWLLKLAIGRNRLYRTNEDDQKEQSRSFQYRFFISALKEWLD
jgi:hypothetical protein